MRGLALGCALLVLTACGGQLAELRAKQPVAGDFSSSLAAEYLAYAESEAQMGRHLAAEHFSGKGLAAARGDDVPLDEAASSASKAGAIRAVLVQALDDDAKRSEPQALARLQVLYDCWLNEEKRGIDGASACSDEFLSSYERLFAEPLL